MAVFLNNQVGFKLGTVDLSDHVKSITINQKFDELEVTAMGSTGHQFVKGLESSTVVVSFLNDTATAQVLSTLQTAYGASTAFKAVNTGGATPTISATNPLYSGLVLVNNLTPINGSVSDISTQDITFTVNGSITYATTGSW